MPDKLEPDETGPAPSRAGTGTVTVPNPRIAMMPVPVTLAVSVTHTEGAAVVTFRGDLDLATRGQLRSTLADMIRLEPALVVVDLSQVGLFDCGAIGDFVRARSALRELGSTLVLRAPSAAALRVLEIVGLLDLVSVASLRDIGPVSPAWEPATLASDVAVLRDAWRTACETHQTMSWPVVFGEPDLIIAEILRALDPGAGPFRSPAGASLPDTLDQDVPVAQLAVLQLLELRRVMQSWIDWCGFSASRLRELQHRLSDALDIAILDVVATAMGELERAALVDPLTGLMNRRALDRDLTQFLAAARRHGRALTVVMLDVVGLKSTNDRFGHDVGDRLLKDVSAALAGSLRVGDNVYRVGGDEFVLLLPDMRPEDVDAVMDRTVVGAGGSFTWGSAGVPRDFPTVAGTPELLLKLADQRMIDHRAGATRGVIAGLNGTGRPTDDRLSHDRLAGESPQLVRKLTGATRSRAVIEQAKGILAEYFETDVQAAGTQLEDYAERRGESVRRVAYALVDRTLNAAELLAGGSQAIDVDAERS